MKKNVYALKVGSNLLTDGNGVIKVQNILSICQQVAKLLQSGKMAFIVSSGAIASEPDKSMTRNLRAVIGQPELISLYKSFFKIYDIKCGQLLLTDRDFESRIVRNVLIEAFEKKIVLILNANDGTDNKESGYLTECADNDRLLKKAVLSAKEYIAGAVIGFEKKGALNNSGKVIHFATKKRREEIMSYAKGGSELGQGKNGGRTKFSVAFDLAEAEVPTVVVPGSEANFFLKGIRRIVNQNYQSFGTLFI